MTLTVGSAFSGIGGIDLGLQRAGMEIRWQIEIDDWCCRVLEKHWPHVKRYRDIRTIDAADLEPVDVIAGGFPCQPVSVAGRRKGDADDRWLWDELARLIRTVRPRWVLVENVPGLRSIDDGRLFGTILRDLAACGYDAEWDGIPASAAGAHHIRDRVWIVAYPRCSGAGVEAHRDCGSGWTPANPLESTLVRQEHGENRSEGHHAGCEAPANDASPRRDARIFGAGWALRDGARWPESERRGVPAGRCTGWLPEPDVVRVVHGVPTELDRARLRGLGNAVVPQVVELIGHRIAAAADTPS